MNIQIEKLSGNNYATWAQDVKYLLMERQLYDLVTGSEKLPIEGKEGVVPKDILDYRRRSQTAISIICLNIDGNYRKIVESIEDPKQVWQTLFKYYNPDSRTTHMKLFTELMECHMDPEETISMFAARVRRIYHQIHQMDKTFNEIYSTFQVLRHLAPRFDSIVQTILRVKEDDFNFENTVNELVAEETRLNLRDADNQKLNIRVNTITSKKIRRCYGCNKPGHFLKNCPSKNEYRRNTTSPSMTERDDVRCSRCHQSSPRRPRNESTTNYPTFQSRGGRQISISQRRDSSSRERSPPTTGGRWKSKKRQSRFVGKDDDNRKCKSYFISASVNKVAKDMEWVFDSAATHHFCKDREMFVNFEHTQYLEMEVASGGTKMPIEGKGVVKLKFNNEFLYLNNVMYSSNLNRNLISGPKLDEIGFSFMGERGEICVKNRKRIVFKAVLKNGLYRVYPKIPGPKKNVSFKAMTVREIKDTTLNKKNNLNLWHRRMAHISPTLIKQTNNNVNGLPEFKNYEMKCENCKLGKFRRISFKRQINIRSKRPLELLFMDVWGPCQITGKDSEKYYLTIIDDFSKKVSLYPLREKSEVAQLVIRHIDRAENFLELRVKAIRSDNGSEFVNTTLDNYLTRKGIKHELTNVYTPEQNGVAERYNQTVVDGARVILKESNISLRFWPDAMLYVTYTYNRICHENNRQTPFELFCQQRPSVRHLKPFGCIAYAGIPRQKRRKLDAKAVKGIMVGYAFRTRGYRIWIPEYKRMVETSNVKFDENNTYEAEEMSGEVLGPLMFGKVGNESEDFFNGRISNDDQNQAGPSREIESESEADSSSDSIEPDTRRIIKWRRKPVPRPDGSRTDVYYYPDGKGTRLRSLNEVERYCNKNNLVFNTDRFDFSGANSFAGIEDDSNDSIGASSS